MKPIRDPALHDFEHPVNVVAIGGIATIDANHIRLQDGRLNHVLDNNSGGTTNWGRIGKELSEGQARPVRRLFDFIEPARESGRMQGLMKRFRSRRGGDTQRDGECLLQTAVHGKRLRDALPLPIAAHQTLIELLR